MLKKRLAVVSILGAIALLGAGCSNGSETNNPPAGGNENTNSTTPTTTVSTPETSSTSAYNLKVSSIGNGRVKMEWTAPEGMEKTSVFKVMYASRPGSDRPFWATYMRNATSAELYSSVGKKYFSICEYKNSTCVNTSSEVEVDVQ